MLTKQAKLETRTGGEDPRNVSELDRRTDDRPPLTGIRTAVEELTTRVGELEESHRTAIEAAGLGEGLVELRSAISALEESANQWQADANWNPPVDAINERLNVIDSQLARARGAGGDPEVRTMAGELMASEEFRTYQPEPDGALVIPQGHLGAKMPIRSILDPLNLRQALTTSDLAIRPVDYRPGIVSPTLETMNLAQRIAYVPAPGALSWNVRKETMESMLGYVTATLAAAIDGDPTPKTTVEFSSVDGFVENTYARFLNADSELLKRVLIVSINTTTKVVTFGTNELDFDADSGWRVNGEVYGAVAESGTKGFAWARVVTSVEALKTLPILMAVTEQQLSSVAGMEAWIENKLRIRALRDKSWHLLKGDGTDSRELAGWDNAANAQSYAWSAGDVGDNRFDAIFRASAMIPWTGTIAVVMNKQDLVRMILSKGSDGQYIRSDMFGDLRLVAAGGRLFAGPFEIIIDDACIELDFYVANLSECSELIDAQVDTMRWGWIDGQFADNEITARLDQRHLHSITVEEAIVLGEFDNAPT